MTKFLQRAGLIFGVGGLLISGLNAHAQDSAPVATPMGMATPAALGNGMPPQPMPVSGATDNVQGQATPADAGVSAALTPALPGEINPNDIPSMLFTFWEHTAIADAKRSRGLVRPPTEDELTRDLKTRDTQRLKPPPEEREIKLGGIVFVNSKDWTIWLNGKRVTPKAIPKEVMDLKVYGEYIEMKWFDEYTNQIFPLRLRPHERFNIDTRIFLPG